jgi:hypothetical protein
MLNAKQNLVDQGAAGPCPLCGSGNARILFSGPDYNYRHQGLFAYVRCPGCGLVHQHPRPKAESLPFWYQTCRAGGEPARKEAGEAKLLRPINGWRARALENRGGPGALLDVGCGEGIFLEFMRRKGWRVHGLDFNEAAVEACRMQYGLNSVVQGAWPAIWPRAEWQSWKPQTS